MAIAACSDKSQDVQQLEEILNRGAGGRPVDLPDQGRVSASPSGDEIRVENGKDSFVIRDVLLEDGKSVPTLYHVVEGVSGKKGYEMGPDASYVYKRMGTFRRQNFEEAVRQIRGTCPKAEGK